MATLFDSASLALIPSGVKDGKAYSIKPTDGSGDFTFSRGTGTATRVNASGLIEKERGNLLLQSNTFDTTWSTINTSVTGGQSGYDGSSDAWLLSKSNASAYINQSFSSGNLNTFSIYAKAGSLNWVAIQISGAPSPYAYFDLSGSGAIGSEVDVIDSVIESIGGGWFRISIAGNNTNFNGINIYPADADDNLSGSSGNIYIQDAQLESGLVATDYIETTTAAVYEGITDNLPRLDYSGGASCPSLLLEPSRTNLIDHSEYINGLSKLAATVSSNNITSPEGVDNGSKLIPDSGISFSIPASGIYTAGASSYVRSGGLTLTAADYTFSVFVKKGDFDHIQLRSGTDVDLTANASTNLVNLNDGTSSVADSVEDYGNGWYRVSLTFTATAATWYVGLWFWNTTSVTANGSQGVYAYGAQLEAGSYPTSYIPTYGTAASRAADSYYVNGLNSIHDTSNGFVLMFDYSEVEEGDSAFQDYFSIQQLPNTDTGFRAEAAGASNSEWRLYTDNITSSLSFPMTLSNIASRRKVLIKIETTGISIFADGSLITSQSGSVTIPTLGTLQPSRSTSQPALTGIKQSLGMIYFSPLLTDAECIALTTI